MLGTNARNARKLGLTALTGALLILGRGALAGGMAISLEVPPANSDDPKIREAGLLVHIVGCQEPSVWKASATAEGLVDGRRKTVEVKTEKIKDGFFAVKRSWPTQGVWLLVVRGGHDPFHSSLVVPLGRDGKLTLGKKDEQTGKSPVQCKAYYDEKLVPEAVNERLKTLAAERGSTAKTAAR